MSNASPNTPQPFDFESAFGPAPGAAPAPGLSFSPTSMHAPAVTPRAALSDLGELPVNPERRGQGLSLAALIVGVVAALAIGVGMYEMLASVSFSPPSLRDTWDWLNLVVFGLCIGVLALAGSIVALVRASPRTIATLALVAAVVLPIIAVIIGTRLGAEVLMETAYDQLVDFTGELSTALTAVLEKQGIEVGPIIRLILSLLN